MQYTDEESELAHKLCKQCTSYVTFSHAVNTHSLLHITLHGSRMCWCASSHLHRHPCVRLDGLFSSLFLTLFLCVCFSNLLLLLPEL